VQANVGEVIAWRNLFWSLSDAMVRDPKPWIGDYVLPNMDPGNAYQIIATMAYTKVKYLIEQTVASGLIYLNSHASDFKNDEIRPYLDRYLRGSNGYKAEERVKAAQAVVGLHRQRIRRPARALRDQLWRLDRGDPPLLPVRRAGSGNADRFKGFAEDCMAEYDLDGWKVPDLTDPGELSYHMLRK
jgi:4-hydroxyphenylacetate 3-monooxygenase